MTARPVHDDVTAAQAGECPLGSGTDRARARAEGYRLVGDLFARGPRPDVLHRFEALGVDVPEASAAASSWLNVVSFTAFPFESAFLEANALVGGDRSRAMSDWYQRAGVALDPTGEAADHLGMELGLLASLCDAVADGRGVADRLEAVTRAVLERHLLQWLPAFVVALADSPYPLYGRAAELALALAAEHCRNLGGHPSAPDLPEPPAVLDDPRAGADAIGRVLATPAFSGLFVGQHHLARLGRRLGAPRGFGSRTQVIGNLLRSGGSLDCVPEVVDGLRRLVANAVGRFDAIGAEHPDLVPVVAAWTDRLRCTGELLQRIADTVDARESDH